MNRSTRRQRHLAVAQDPAPRGVSVPEPGTVGEYLEEWLWGKQSLRPSTHLAYETHIRRYLVPHLGSVELVALRAAHLEAMYRQLALSDGTRTLSVATLRRIHATLTSALSTAVRRG